VPESQIEIRSIMKEPSAHIPLVMSLIGLALVVLKVLGDVATHGAVVHEADEGIEAHLWQLLMVGQAMSGQRSDHGGVAERPGCCLVSRKGCFVKRI
jgi:hypothetical protein